MESNKSPSDPPEPIDPGQSGMQRRRKRRSSKRSQHKPRFPWIWIANLVVVAAVGVGVGYLWGNQEPPESPREEPPTQPTVTRMVGKLYSTQELNTLNLAQERAHYDRDRPDLVEIIRTYKEDHDTPAFRFLEARLLAQQGESVASNNILLQLIQERDLAAPAYLLRARLLAGQGQTDSAIASLEEGVRFDPLDPMLQYYWGQILRASGRLRSGVERLEQALYRSTGTPLQPFMETSLRVARVEQGETPNLNQSEMDRLIVGAALALRDGDRSQAAALLREARDFLPSAWFDFLVRDPFFAEFRFDPELEEFQLPGPADLAPRPASAPSPGEGEIPEPAPSAGEIEPEDSSLGLDTDSAPAEVDLEEEAMQLFN